MGERDDMPELLASALVFVLPSYYAEGLPKVLLEAAASGLPIITTDHPGCRDAIINEETGLLVPVKDRESLAMAIISLLENQELKKLQQSCSSQRDRRAHKPQNHLHL